MELIKTISDIDDLENAKCRIREASRAILFDENKLIPLFFVSKNNYHKLPGGGIDSGESILEALNREILEEVGSTIKVNGEVGSILEYRAEQENLKQTSYCFYSDIVSKGEPDFTDHELSNGFELIWVSLDDAISLLENDNPKDYSGSFITKRDLILLKKTKEVI